MMGMVINMSPRHPNDKKNIQDSTTEFFLKVVQKEKEKASKENSTKENMSYTKNKTIDTVGRFYNYINQTLDRILASKASIMVLSFLMAGALFLTIAGNDIFTSPTTSGTTLENIELKIEGQNTDLELTGAPDSVQVILLGPSFDIFKMNMAKDYEVYLDLTDLEAGEHTVKLKTRNFPDSLTVAVVPDNLKIKLAEKQNRSFELGTRFINEDELDTKYSVSVDEMAVDNVTVRASQETLDKIERVDACIDVADKTEAFKQVAQIKAYDSNGDELKVDISPSTVEVNCDVASYSKSVTIQANFVGDMPSGYQVSNYTLSQSQVTIYGLESKIKDISVVYVDIDVSELKATTTYSGVTLKKIAGINKFSLSSLDVTVEVEKVITKKFDNIPIKVLNNSQNYKVSFAGEGNYASVAITGSESKVSSLTADNIQASVDVDGLRVGTRRVNVKAVVDDEKLGIELLSSSKVTINIERN